MYKNFEEYQKRYFEKYYKQVSKIETNKKYSFSLFAKQFSFLSFVLVFSYFVLFYDANVNSKYNSEEVNMMYSQKFIDNDDIYYNSIHLNKNHRFWFASLKRRVQTAMHQSTLRCHQVAS